MPRNHLPKSSDGSPHLHKTDYLYRPDEEKRLGVPTSDEGQMPADAPPCEDFREALIYCMEGSPYRFEQGNESRPQSAHLAALHVNICRALKCNDECVKLYPGICTPMQKDFRVDFTILYFDPWTERKIPITAMLHSDLQRSKMTKFSTDLLIEPGGRVIANPEFYKKFPFNTDEITDEAEIDDMLLGKKITKGDRKGEREEQTNHGLFVYGGEDVIPFAKGTAAVVRSIIKAKAEMGKDDDPNIYHFIDRETRRSIAQILARKDQSTEALA